MEQKSTGGVIGIIVVIIVIIVGGIFFWGNKVSPAREKAMQENIVNEQTGDELTQEIDALGDVNVNTDLPDLSN